MHGRGVFEWSNGFRYEGELRDGKQYGYGTYMGANGERYEGGWREGRPHGQGTYVQGDGTTYEGAWRDGCFGDRESRWASIGNDGGGLRLRVARRQAGGSALRSATRRHPHSGR